MIRFLFVALLSLRLSAAVTAGDPIGSVSVGPDVGYTKTTFSGTFSMRYYANSNGTYPTGGVTVYITNGIQSFCNGSYVASGGYVYWSVTDLPVGLYTVNVTDNYNYNFIDPDAVIGAGYLRIISTIAE